MAQDDAKGKGRVVLTEEELLAVFGGNEEYNPYGEWDDDDPKRYINQLNQYCGTKETPGECRPPLCQWVWTNKCRGLAHQSVAGTK